MTYKIIQIIPTPENMRVSFNQCEGKQLISQVACLGLTEHGDVVIMDCDADGTISVSTEANNFSGIFFK